MWQLNKSMAKLGSTALSIFMPAPPQCRPLYSRDLSFQYNYLNLPNYITNTGGAEITLTYTAYGEKLTKVSTAGTRNYVSGIEYLGANLDAIYHAEGRCTPNGASAFHYEYTLKDHLGNAE